MTFYSQIDIANLRIINVGQGVNPADAINKQQLDNAIATVQTTASNGVKKIGNDIRLGGTLAGLASIDAQGNTVLISNGTLQVLGNGAVAGAGPFAAQNNAALNLLFCENHGRVGMSGYMDIMSTATNQFGGSTVNSFPVSRTNAAYVKVAPGTNTAIHIELNKTLTAAPWDLLVQFNGCLPGVSSNTPSRFTASTYCQMNNTVTTVSQIVGLTGTQRLTWYRSAAGKPVLKIDNNVALLLGNSSFGINLNRGGFDDIPDISQIVLNTGANL